jgi:hypothetical protein
MLAGSALIAPRLQLYTYLMCKDLDDTTYGRIQSVDLARTIPCAADPVVQVNVAKFLTSQCVIQITNPTSYEIQISHGDGGGHP